MRFCRAPPVVLYRGGKIRPATLMSTGGWLGRRTNARGGVAASTACSRGCSLVNKDEIKGTELSSYKPGSLQRGEDTGKGGLGIEPSSV